MKKIVLVLPTLGGGGAEKVMLALADNLDYSKFDVVLVVIDKRGEHAKYQNSNIKIYDLETVRVSKSFFKVLKVFKKEKPDVVLSSSSHLNIMMSFIKFLLPKIKFLGREVSIMQINLKHFSSWPFAFLKLFLNHLDGVIAQSEYMKDYLIHESHIRKGKIHILNNPVDFNNIYKLMRCEQELFDKKKKNIVAVGRFWHVKGYDRMLEVFSTLENIEDYTLNILGDGPLKDALYNKANELGISKQVHFLGFVQNPYKYIKQADLFLITSYREAFPNVVLEANACGKFVVGFNCPGGIREIIKHDINGQIVKDGDRFLLKKAIEGSFGKNDSLIENEVQKYKVETIVAQYERLLLSILRG